MQTHAIYVFVHVCTSSQVPASLQSLFCAVQIAFTMASLWTSGKKGSLSPWSQALVVAMFKISSSKELDMSYADIAGCVTKVGGGHPSKQAIAALHDSTMKDKQWYPGKVKPGAKKRGPKTKFGKAQKQMIANSAMALKKAGAEPTVATVIARCPRAATNPATRIPFTAPTISKVFKTMCYDVKPEEPWACQSPYQKTALPQPIIDQRLAWAKEIKKLGKSPMWYMNNCIWMDPCNTVVPAAKRTVFDQQQKAMGRHKRWISKDARQYSRNLKAAAYAGKQKQWADKRIWWFVVLTRGQVFLKMMPNDWEQTGYGMAEFVDELQALLKGGLAGNKKLPTIMVTDRGPGLYQAASGTIVAAYKEALSENGFKPFAGDEAKWQPPDVPDVLLHETVVAWVRAFFKKHPFKSVSNVRDNQKLFAKLLKQCESHINANYEVAALCKSFPRRIVELIASRGDRLRY